MFPQVNMLFAEMETEMPELGRHGLAVAHLADELVIGTKAEVGSWEMEAAAMLHDYGKILWPAKLFFKNRRDLSRRDLEIISSHPQVGRRIVTVRWPKCSRNILRLIESHHDPGGWFPAQVLAICDVWVACHEDRIYRRKAVPERDVLQEMLRVAPERVVNLLLDTVRHEAMCAAITIGEHHAISF